MTKVIKLARLTLWRFFPRSRRGSGNAAIGMAIAMDIMTIQTQERYINMCVRKALAPNREDENVNWLALTDDEVFDLWHAIRDEAHLSDVAERLRLMFYGKPQLVN